MSEQPQPQFGIQRIYMKDSSFESPNSPNIFRQPWEPEVKLDMNTRTAQLEEGVFEVTLMLTVTAKLKEETAFLVEVQQAGVFQVANFEEAQRNHMLGAYIPNILFPYARSAIDTLITQGSFPPVMLAPINFDAVYQQAVAEKEKTEGATAH